MIAKRGMKGVSRISVRRARALQYRHFQTIKTLHKAPDHFLNHRTEQIEIGRRIPSSASGGVLRFQELTRPQLIQPPRSGVEMPVNSTYQLEVHEATAAP